MASGKPPYEKLSEELLDEEPSTDTYPHEKPSADTYPAYVPTLTDTGIDPAYPPPNTTNAYPTSTASAPYPVTQEPPPPYPGPNTNQAFNPGIPAAGAFQQTTPYPPQQYPPQQYPPQQYPPPQPQEPSKYYPQGPPAQQPPPTTVFVTNNQQLQQPVAPASVTIVRQLGTAPNNYMGLSIFSTLCCCLVFGIVAIVKSSQVNTLWAQGRHEEAQKAAASAKSWSIAAVVVGIIIIIVANVLRVFAYSSGSDY